jgi:hypothetical protein
MSIHEKPPSVFWAGLVAGSTVLGITALTAPFVFLRSPLPYMATPKHKVRRALQHIDNKVHNKRKGVFLDLGSGDGEAVYQAVQSGYRQVIGIELNWTLYCVSQLRRLSWKADQRNRTAFLCRDFFQEDFGRADTVMIFGVQPLMKPLSVKIGAECRPGTHILSYRFPFPLFGDGEKGLLRAELIYDEEEMRIYECLPSPRGTTTTTMVL